MIKLDLKISSQVICKVLQLVSDRVVREFDLKVCYFFIMMFDILDKKYGSVSYDGKYIIDNQ